MTYLRARYYDSDIRRFITEDPIKDGLNWYSYAGNNPISFFDTNGLKSERHNAFDLEELKVQIMNIVSCQIRWNGSSDERREQLNIWANEARTLINKHLEEVFYNDDLRTVIGSVLSVGSELSVEETSALLCVIEYYQSQLDYPEEKEICHFSH